jgi:hypothetical protein
MSFNSFFLLKIKEMLSILLFALSVISLPTIFDNSHDCAIVQKAWLEMGGKTTDQDNSCCGIDGVYCDDNQVIAIEWINLGLSGSISPLLGQLSQLQLL